MRLAKRHFGASALALVLCGCVPSARLEGAPPWFAAEVERARAADYPRLAAVPQPSPSSRPPAAWNELEASLQRDAQRLRESPRSASAPGDSVQQGDAFERRMRETLRPLESLPAPSAAPVSPP